MVFLEVWAKKQTSTDGNDYHSLAYHMLDTAAVTRAILARLVHSRRITGLPPECIAYLAALHDIGKATPAFQGLDDEKRALLEREGLSFRGSSYEHRHDSYTGAIVVSELGERFSSIERRDLVRASLILGGHHGLYPTIDYSRIPLSELGTGEWAQLRAELADEVSSIVGCPVLGSFEALSLADSVELTGLISVADWITSNEHFFPYCDGTVKLDDYWVVAQELADAALDALNWELPSQDRLKRFEDLFGFEPRPLQEAVAVLGAELHGQSLVIIEAPTGEGKTEAALYLANRLSVGGQRGCYLALPTQATSNQMFRRVADYLNSAFQGELPNLVLLHGHASLSSELKVIEVNGEFAVSSIDGEHDIEEQVRISEWFTHTKRGLLAMFGVGTVDQILMAALRTRYVTVRLFGLANKVVIIDELHAYDTYMTNLLSRLLDWLGCMGCSVIMLSATLPRAKTLEFTSRFMRPLGQETVPGLAVYPRITAVSRGLSESRTVSAAEACSRRIRLERATTLESEEGVRNLAARLEYLLEEGGCAAVICNTVKRAQAVYEQLKATFPGNASDGLPVLDLLHARYVFRDRECRETRCLQRFEKGAGRPDRSVLVSTQIIEQSLDLDFDLMATELAPVDLVIQRAGRLHRHDRARPPLLSRPTLILCAPSGPDFEYSVYHRHVLLRSWLALRGLDSIDVPEDVEALVESVYDDRDCPSEMPDDVQELWASSGAARLEQLEIEAQEARLRWLPPPTGKDNDSLRSVTRDSRLEDALDLHSSYQAFTRLVSPSVRAVCMVDQPRGAWPTSASINARPSLAKAAKLLAYSITLPGMRTYRAFRDNVDVPKAWNTPLLRGYFPLVLDATEQARIGDRVLRYDDELGMVIGGDDDA
jgi:CRISPR-associated endonuclease/helicase Cas3